MTWCAETGMMEARDIESSIGLKRASEVEDLLFTVSKLQDDDVEAAEPHAYEVLHHELVQGLGRMCHVNLPLSIPEICLRMVH